MEIPELFSAWDDAIKEYSADWSPDYRCPASCALCCETSPAVPVSPAEAEVAAAAVMNLNPEMRELIGIRIAEILRQMDSSEDQFVDDHADQSIGVRRNLSGPCPLLIDGRCSVYESRPMICRAFGFAADENKFYMGCETLGMILKEQERTILPSWDAAFRQVSRKNALDRNGKELPPQGILAEMLHRLIQPE